MVSVPYRPLPPCPCAQQFAAPSLPGPQRRGRGSGPESGPRALLPAQPGSPGLRSLGRGVKAEGPRAPGRWSCWQACPEERVPAGIPRRLLPPPETTAEGWAQRVTPPAAAPLRPQQSQRRVTGRWLCLTGSVCAKAAVGIGVSRCGHPVCCRALAVPAAGNALASTATPGLCPGRSCPEEGLPSQRSLRMLQGMRQPRRAAEGHTGLHVPHRHPEGGDTRAGERWGQRWRHNHGSLGCPGGLRARTPGEGCAACACRSRGSRKVPPGASQENRRETPGGWESCGAGGGRCPRDGGKVHLCVWHPQAALGGLTCRAAV